MSPIAESLKKTSRITSGIFFAATALGLTYPFLVYIGWQRVNPRLFMGGAFLLFGLRFCLTGSRMDRSQWKDMAFPWLLPAVFLLISFLFGRRKLVLYWPTVISKALLIAFGRTLAHPPTLVERFALLQKPELTPAEIAYCRKVTQLWCLFFIGNGAIALYLARLSSLKAWTLYNGLISYFLIGGLMSLEYGYRHWRFRPKGALLTEWINRWSR